MTSNKVLFLDFDGPLFPDRQIKYCRDQRKAYPGRVDMRTAVTYWKMDPLAVDMLNNLYDFFPFETVVSSTWKRFINREQCDDLFYTNGLGLTLADDWRTIDLMTPRPSDAYGGCLRSSEIIEYVQRHEVSDYICLDDPWSGSSLERDDQLNPDNIIMVNPDVGISSLDYIRMFDVVKRWDGRGKVTSNLWST